MPYININASTPMTQEQMRSLREAIAELMPLLPTKTRDNTMIQIQPDCFIQIGDPDQPCAFVDIRLFGSSPEKDKELFVHSLCKLLEEQLGIPQSRIYMNIAELYRWVANGQISMK